MTRKVRTVLIVISVVGIAAASTYLVLRPKWATATREEIDRVIDPRLLVKEPPDRAAEARYARLIELFKQVPKVELDLVPSPSPPPGMPGYHDSSKPLPRPQIIANYRKEATSILPQIGKLLAEGPFRHPSPGKYDEMPFQESLTRLRSGLALLIEDPSVPIGERVAAVNLGLLLSLRMFEASATLVDAMRAFSVSSRIETPTRRFLTSSKLNSQDAKAILAHLPDLERASSLRRPIIEEFKAYTYPFIADPVAFIGPAPATEKDPDSLLDDLVDPVLYDFPGNFDAIATAKEYSDLAIEHIKFSEAPPGMFPTPVQDRIERVSESLPEASYVDQREISHWWGRQVYRFKMSQIPNSFAYYVASDYDIKNLVSSRDNTRAWHNLLRAQVACVIYNKEKGHWPTALADLVMEKILPNLPTDPFNGKPLRYDSHRKILWSIGRNGIDDGASEKKINGRPEDNVVHLE